MSTQADHDRRKGRMEHVAQASVDLVGLTRSLVDIDSTTGREGAAAFFLSKYLKELGFAVVEQQVDDTRFNVLATAGPEPPVVVYSTHFDCVPPFFPSRIESGRIYGRGACDAKGILAAQVAAADDPAAPGRDAGRPAVRGRRGAGQRRCEARERRGARL